MTYTLQSDLDDLGLGARWGCTLTNFINAGEHTAGRTATEPETSLIIGRAFRARLAAMANYKHWDYVSPPRTPPEGWGADDNPEWHYYVLDRAKLLSIVNDSIGVIIQPSRYRVAIMLTQYGGEHYCLKAVGRIINPDPALYGDIIRTTEFLY